MARPQVSEELKRKNVGFSLSHATPLLLKGLVKEAGPFKGGLPRSEGRIIDHLIYDAFFAQVDSLTRAAMPSASAELKFDPEDLIWTLGARGIGLMDLAPEALEFFLVEGEAREKIRVQYFAPAVASMAAEFLSNGIKGDPRRRGFPKDADVMFFPSYRASSQQMPIAITFIAGEHVEFFATQGDRLLPTPPKGTFVYIKTADGREFRGRVMGSNVTDLPNIPREMTLVVHAHGR